MLKWLLTAGHFVLAASPSQAAVVTWHAPKGLLPEIELVVALVALCCAGVLALVVLASMYHCPHVPFFVLVMEMVALSSVSKALSSNPWSSSLPSLHSRTSLSPSARTQ